MGEVITQAVVLPGAAETLFNMYLNAAEHEAVTGAPVKIGANPGSEFWAFGGALSGKILAAASPHLIVQTWRSTDFKPDDPDSTLILGFIPQGSSCQIDLVHLNVPDHDLEAVREGWEKFYWTPWRAYLTRLMR